MLKKLSGFALALFGLTILLGSCKKDYESIQSVDAKKIQDYIAKNNLTGMVEDPLKTGYYYQIVNEGTGSYFTSTDTVMYDGVLKGMENGTAYFTTSVNGNLKTFVGYTNSFFALISPATTGYNLDIPAIRDVMYKLKPGGSARLLLPSNLVFGKNGSGDIPSNENIDLTITTYNETQDARDDRLIEEFIATKGLNMTKDPLSGVWFSVTKKGDGLIPIDRYSTLEVAYTGRLRDGTIFDSSTSYTLALSSFIQGWVRTLPGNVVDGGQIRMIIPSRLAYGGSSSGLVPTNAILDFDVEILSVTE